MSERFDSEAPLFFLGAAHPVFTIAIWQLAKYQGEMSVTIEKIKKGDKFIFLVEILKKED